jgi:putative peptidoglycan lipid II flippase
LVTGAEGEAAARALAWGVLLAGVLQLAWVAVAAGRAGLAPALAAPLLSPEVRRLGRLVGPGLLGAGVLQLNILVASWFATHLPAGTVAYLFYADRLVQLPLGVVGVALGTALLPAMSRAVREGGGYSHAVLNRALELGLLLALPAAVGLALLAGPIVAVLFERGAFDGEAARATAQVLAALALGLPAQVLAKVLAPGFFAREDTATPVRIALAALAVNIGAALLLTPTLGHVGLALALSLSGWAHALGLAWLLARHHLLRPDRLLHRRIGAMLAAALAMAGVLLAAGGLLAVPALPSLLLVIVVAGVVYLLTAWAAGGVDRFWWRAPGALDDARAGVR